MVSQFLSRQYHFLSPALNSSESIHFLFPSKVTTLPRIPDLCLSVVPMYTSAMISEKQQFQLELLNDIFTISDMCSTKTYIWGGLAIDIVEGHFLREHNDIDCFTMNLLDVKQQMETQFLQKGYAVTFLDEVDMLQVKKNGCHAAFNRLEIDNDIAMWRHIGNEGTVFFPQSWLNDTKYNFYDTGMLVSGAEFEYSLKANVRLLSPVWKLRQKDILSLEYWTNVLKKRNINPESILHEIWSDNPYWRKRGYEGY